MIFYEEKTLYSHKILENIKDNEDIGKSVFAKKNFLCQLYSPDCHGGEKLVCSIVLLRFITELNSWINKSGW